MVFYVFRFICLKLLGKYEIATHKPAIVNQMKISSNDFHVESGITWKHTLNINN